MKKSIQLVIVITVLAGMTVIALWNSKGLYGGETSWMPAGLKVELMNEPYGVNSHDPTFTWYVNGNDNNVYQKAYQIVISQTLNDMEKENYIADTGWVNSSENTYVKIENALHIFMDNSVYWWKVRVKDTNENISEYSEVTSFSIGVGKEWKSLDGIWNAEKSDYCFFRTEFMLDERPVEKALLSVTALSPEETRQYVYNVYINEDYVGSGPARLRGERVSYNTYDVTSLLERENALGAICYSNTGKAFLCQLTCFYADGSKETILCTGKDEGDWKTLNGDEAYGKNESMIGTPYYVANAENINAEKYPDGWLEPKYDASDWKEPEITKCFSQNDLYAYETENMQKYFITPQMVKYKGRGHYFVDLGKEIVGGIAIDVFNRNFGPTEVTFRYGEELDEEGNVKYQMRTGNIYEEKWRLNAGAQRYENIGMKAFRYIDIYADNISFSPARIKGVALRQPFDDEQSYFKSSCELLNDIYDMTKYTIKATNQNLYVDSQSRERGAYEGDVWINMLASYAFEDRYTLARVSNDYLAENRTWPAEYPMYAVLCTWQDYMYTGNADSLMENYGYLKLFMEELIVDENCGLIRNDYGEDGFNRPLVDWPETERDDYRYDEAEYNTVVNAMACCAYGTMAKIAGVLGMEADEEWFLKAWDQLKKSMTEYLYDDNVGAFSDGLTKDYERIEHFTQHATAYALYAMIYDNSDMRNKLVSYLQSQNQIKMSVFGAYFLLQGLYNNDAGTYATQLLTSGGNSHTWEYMIRENGATISAEAWSVEVKDNMTLSHPWGASPAALIVQGIFGIVPREAGFDEFQIKLQPGNIKKASIRVPTIKGKIECSYVMDEKWKLDEMEVVIPSNTGAVLMIPIQSVTEGVVYINNQCEPMKREGDYMCVYLGSGEYMIRAELDQGKNNYVAKDNF